MGMALKLLESKEFMLNTVLILILAIVLALALLMLLSLSQKRTRIDQAFYRNSINTIRSRLNSGDYQMVVMDCDKLMDRALIDLKLKGSTMGERLKNAKNLRFNLDQVWRVHKLRNQVAHELGLQISKKDAEAALSLTVSNLSKLKLI